MYLWNAIIAALRRMFMIDSDACSTLSQSVNLTFAKLPEGVFASTDNILSNNCAKRFAFRLPRLGKRLA